MLSWCLYIRELSRRLHNVRQPSMMASMARRLGNLVLSSGYERWPALRDTIPPWPSADVLSGAEVRELQWNVSKWVFQLVNSITLRMAAGGRSHSPW